MRAGAARPADDRLAELVGCDPVLIVPIFRNPPTLSIMSCALGGFMLGHAQRCARWRGMCLALVTQGAVRTADLEWAREEVLAWQAQRVADTLTRGQT